MSMHGQDKEAYEKYCILLKEAQRLICDGSPRKVLKCILEEMHLKVEGRWSDKNFDKHTSRCKLLLDKENNLYPDRMIRLKEC